MPDIYKSAKISDGWIELATDLKKGDRVRLIGEKHDDIHEVLEVEEERFLTAYRPSPKSDPEASGSPDGDGKTKIADKDTEGKSESAMEADRIFVFGREVKDFRGVDYEAIAMLNVSATQELARQLKEKDAEIGRLRAQLTAIEDRDRSREERLAKLERAIGDNAPRAAAASMKLQ